MGISYGLDVILTALTMGDSPFEARSADVFVIPLGTEAEALGLANLIRKSTSLRVEVELMGRRLKKALDYANKERIPYVLIFGENERAAGTVVVKNMISGEERTIRIKDEKDWPSIFTQMQA